jgi:flagellar protein FlaG
MVTESWVRSEQGNADAQKTIQPVPENTKSGGGKINDNSGSVGYSAFDNSGETDSDVESLLADVQDYVSEMNIGLDFRVDPDSDELVVQVLNRDTGEVIRQIPSEALMELRQKLEDLRGVLFVGEG